MRVTPFGAAVRFVMGAIGGLIAWHAAPDIETAAFPIFENEHLVPFDASRPDVLAELQLDRICWSVHFRKIRSVEAVRRSITIILPSGVRYFMGPLDARTGDPYSNKDARPNGWEGDSKSCSYLPNSMDTSQGFSIESYGQYRPPHHLWLIDHEGPVINVPPMSGDRE